ncbi:hypothetical protein MMC17_000225, partial [Xylographa soralifera]|nr:hypothetical protein [Xylographa soralifera]
MPYIPLCKRLWDFLLDLRESDAEGVWIDQVCIHQDDIVEKAAASASMDALYASARLVFIAVEDVRSTYREARVLSQAFATVSSDTSWKVPIEAARDLFSILGKLFKARLFSRAWCFQEYHTSNQKIIALHHEGAAPEDPDSIIGLVNLGDFRFSLPCLESEPFKSEFPGLLEKMLRFFGGQGYACSNIIENTFQFGSLYIRDKVTIVLNISKLALFLQPNGFKHEDMRK